MALQRWPFDFRLLVLFIGYSNAGLVSRERTGVEFGLRFVFYVA